MHPPPLMPSLVESTRSKVYMAANAPTELVSKLAVKGKWPPASKSLNGERPPSSWLVSPVPEKLNKSILPVYPAVCSRLSMG